MAKTNKKSGKEASAKGNPKPKAAKKKNAAKDKPTPKVIEIRELVIKATVTPK